MNKEKQIINRQPTYWLCDACAALRDLETYKTGNTVLMGFCGNCESEKEQILTPIVDFREKKVAGNEQR